MCTTISASPALWPVRTCLHRGGSRRYNPRLHILSKAFHNAKLPIEMAGSDGRLENFCDPSMAILESLSPRTRWGRYLRCPIRRLPQPRRSALRHTEYRVSVESRCWRTAECSEQSRQATIVTWLPMECRASSPGHDALDRTKLAQATGTATFVPFLPDFPQPSTALLLAFPRPSSG